MSRYSFAACPPATSAMLCALCRSVRVDPVPFFFFFKLIYIFKPRLIILFAINRAQIEIQCIYKKTRKLVTEFVLRNWTQICVDAREILGNQTLTLAFEKNFLFEFNFWNGSLRRRRINKY
jgi:hypothetical protein